MNPINKVRELVTTMTEHEREACLEVFSKAEHESEVLTKNIQGNIEKLKTGFAELSMDDWDKFCDGFDYLCKGIRQTWALIDRRRHLDEQARSVKRREYVEGMLDRGFKFDQIVIEGEPFETVDGKLKSRLSEDEIPF